MADKDHGGTALPVVAVLGAVLSMQFGAAFATTLFDQAGAAGTVTVLAVSPACSGRQPLPGRR